MDDTDLQTVYSSVIIEKLIRLVLVPGGALPVLQIDKDLMLSFDEVSVVVLFIQTNWHLLNYAIQRTKYFNQIVANNTHVLNNLLPPPSVASQKL